MGFSRRRIKGSSDGIYRFGRAKPTSVAIWRQLFQSPCHKGHGQLGNRKKIADDHRIMTRDAVAYCAHPNETIDLIRKSGAAMVAGNCEKQLAIDAQECGCGFEEGSLCNLLSVGWYRFTTSLLRTDLR